MTNFGIWEKINIIGQVYVAIICTVGFIATLRGQKMGVFSFLLNESIQGLEEKFAGYNQSINAKIITDEDGKVRSINAAMTQLFGFSEEEIVKGGLRLMVPEKFWVAHSEGMKRQKGVEMEDRTYSLQACKKDRSEIPIELKLRKHRNRDRYFYVAIITDLTNQRHKEKAYEDEIKRLKQENNILTWGEKMSSNGSWYWDLGAGKEIDNAVLSVSPNYRNIMGISDTETVNVKYISSRVWSEDVEMVNLALKRAIIDGQNYEISFRVNRTSDFKVIHITSYVNVIKNDEGVVVALYGTTHLIKTLNISEVINNKNANNR